MGKIKYKLEYLFSIGQKGERERLRSFACNSPLVFLDDCFTDAACTSWNDGIRLDANGWFV